MPRLLKFPGSERLYESWAAPLPGDETAAPPPPAAPPPQAPPAPEAVAEQPPTQPQQRYSPDVERWRPMVQQEFAARGLDPAAVDKALYVIEGESGGNQRAANPNSSARGLVQMMDMHAPEAQRLDPAFSIKWMADQVANHGWTDWGEGVTYEGKPFGILGLKPYGGGMPVTRSGSGEVQGGSFAGGGTPALDAYANRLMLGTGEQYSPELTSGSNVNAGQASTASAPPQSKPPAQAPPPPPATAQEKSDWQTIGERLIALDEQDRYIAPKPQVDPATGGAAGGRYGPLTAREGKTAADEATMSYDASVAAAPPVSRSGKEDLRAPDGSLRARAIGQPGLRSDYVDTPKGDKLSPLTAITAPMEMARQATRIPVFTPAAETLAGLIEKYGPDALRNMGVGAVLDLVKPGAGDDVRRFFATQAAGAIPTTGFDIGLDAVTGGGIVDQGAIAAARAGGKRLFRASLPEGAALTGLHSGIGLGGNLEEEAKSAAEEAAKRAPLPGQTGMFGEAVDNAGKLRVPEGPGVVSDPKRGEFGRQGEAFPDPNGGAQPGLLTEGARVPEAINPRSPEGQGAAYGRLAHPTTEQLAENNNALNGMSGHDADAYTLARQLREDARNGTDLANDPTFLKSLEYLTPEEQTAIRARAKAETVPNEPYGSPSTPLPGSPQPEAPRAPTIEQAAQQAPKLTQPQAERVAGDMTRSREMVAPSDITFRPSAFQARDVELGKPFNEPNVKRIVDAWDDNLFEAPIAVPDPEQPGKYVVVAGHHRAEAWRRVKGDEAMPVTVINADIRDPQQLAAVRLLADQTNTATKALNFRELIRTADNSLGMGESVEQTATRMGISPTAVEGLQDAARLGQGAIDRVVQETTLDPYIKELGRGMRLYGITQEDAAGWFKRVADGPKGARPTPAMLRETIEKFGSALADIPQGSLFEAGMFKGDRGGILKMIDENARMRTAIQKNINDTQRQIRAVTKLAGDTPAAQRDAKRLSSLGEGRLKSLRDELKTNEEDLAAAMRGDEPPPRMPPSSEGPPSGVPGAPPPPAGPREFGDDLVSRMIANAESAAVAKPEMEAARSVERAKRVAAALDQLSTSDLSNPSALAATKEKLRGELASQDFEKVVTLTPEEMQTHINRAVASGDVPYYTGITAQKGAEKFGNGRIPNASEMRALGQVFGPEFQAAVERMGDVWKVRGAIEKVIETTPIEIPTTNGEPLTVDVLAGMLRKNIPSGSEETLRTVAQQLLDGERLSIAIGPDGKARVTMNGNRRNALQQAANEYNGRDTFEGVPDQLVPPEQPMMGGARQLSSQEHVTAGPGALEIPPTSEVAAETANSLRMSSKLEGVDAAARAEAEARRQRVRSLSASAAEPMAPAGTGTPIAAPKRAGSREQLAYPGSDWKLTSPKGFAETFWNAFGNIVSAPKTAMSMLDRSGVLRQGGLMVRHGKEMREAVSKTMVIAEDSIDAARLKKAMGLPDSWEIPNAEDVMTGINNSKYADARKQAGLVVEEWGPNAPANKRNENFVSRVFDWVPGAKMSERAFTVFLNKLRADVFDNIAAKWEREGQFAMTPQGMKKAADAQKALATYLNAATGHGNLGAFEGAASAMSRVWFSPRNVAARFQVIGQLMSPTTPYLVRKEMAKDLAVYVGAGVTLLSMAKLSGLADVELDPRSSDFGKMKIGPTRIDMWGGYQQIASMVSRLYTGETKDSTGHIHAADRLEVVGRYLRNKLSPSAGVGVNLLDQTDATGQPFKAKDLLPWNMAQDFAPLFLQDIQEGVKEHGVAGLALLPATYFGLGASTYKTYGEQRDAQAQAQFGKPYDQLLPREQEAVKTSEPIKKLAEEREPSEYMKARDATLQPIQARQDEAEKLFGDGKLKEPLPDIWRSLNEERRGARAALEAAFAKDFDKEHQDAFRTALDGFFNIDEQSGGVFDFDATEAKRQEYLAALPERERQWVEDALLLGREKQTPLRQQYLAYIDKRKAAGYFDLPNDSKRTAALQALDRKNPEQDALNWYFKGGLTADAAAKTPTLNSAAGIEQALKLAPNRPVKMAGVDRPINQDGKSLQAWKDTGRVVDWFLNEVTADPKNLDNFARDHYKRTYAQLNADEQSNVRGYIRADIRKDPKMKAALVWWGIDDSIEQNSAAYKALTEMWTKYGNTPPKAGATLKFSR